MSAAVRRVGRARLALELDLERLNTLVADAARADATEAEELADRIVTAINQARDLLREVLPGRA